MSSSIRDSRPGGAFAQQRSTAILSKQFTASQNNPSLASTETCHTLHSLTKRPTFRPLYAVYEPVKAIAAPHLNLPALPHVTVYLEALAEP